MVNVTGPRAEFSLFFVDQAFEMILDAFLNYFSYYISDGNHPDIPLIVAFKTEAPLQNLNDHALLPLSGKCLGYYRVLMATWLSIRKIILRLELALCPVQVCLYLRLEHTAEFWKAVLLGYIVLNREYPYTTVEPQ